MVFSISLLSHDVTYHTCGSTNLHPDGSALDLGGLQFEALFGFCVGFRLLFISVLSTLFPYEIACDL
jgi:hypothetical protein